MKPALALIALSLLTPACTGQPTAAANGAGAPTTVAAPAALPSATPSAPAAATPAPARDYVGRWVGVEGMVLDVRPTARGDQYRLEMQYDLDHRQTVTATRVGDRLEFQRDGRTLALRPTDGDATGLRYLAGKRDCLTVASGEGYCRN